MTFLTTLEVATLKPADHNCSLAKTSAVFPPGSSAQGTVTLHCTNSRCAATAPHKLALPGLQVSFALRAFTF